MRQGFEMALKHKLAQKTNSLQSEETVLLRSLKYFDTDNDGVISMPEWFKGIEKIGVIVPTLEDLKQLFLYYDRSGEGYIDCKEFCEMIYRTAKPPTASTGPVPAPAPASGPAPASTSAQKQAPAPIRTAAREPEEAAPAARE